jgi:hypothetical protein
MARSIMHRIHLIPIMAVFFTFVCVFVNLRCENPDEFEPPPDTLVTPPAAPGLTSPMDKFVIMPSDFPYDIILDWDTLTRAEKYELEITRSGDTPYAISLDYDSSIFRVYPDTIYFHRYKWRVRATSSEWIGGVTEWSGERAFEVRQRPPPPSLLLPPDGSVFNLDSLSVYFNCRWDTVSDEQFYEIKFMKDTTVVEQNTSPYPQYDFIVYDTGTYYWTVRAGSSLWQQYSFWAGPWSFTVIDTVRQGDGR